MKEPDFFYRGTSTVLERHVLHLYNDDALDKLIREGKPELYRLADSLRREHEARFGETLRISEKSLATEIRLHCRVYELAMRLPPILRKTALVKRAIRSTRVIDCGDRHEDGNRWVWDFLSHFTKAPGRLSEEEKQPF